MITVRVMTEEQVVRCVRADDEGFGALRCARGHLPLKAMEVQARVTGLLCQTVVRQTFVNAFEEPLETTYIFPLPDRAAVTAYRMEINGRVIEGQLKERGAARAEYDEAIEHGHRASITEEERPGVFTMRAGNLMPGESATVVLTLVGPLPWSNGEATFRFPLVVAPRYIPGRALPGNDVGDGVSHDTDAVPDASRISPPTMLPGYPNPVRLSVSVDLDALNIPFSDVACSLHTAVSQLENGRVTRIRLQPGERLDRDFILRFTCGADALSTSVMLSPDATGGAGTFALMLLPPPAQAVAQKPRDVVFLLDRSGSMKGWKMLTARRAVARMVDTLRAQDRFTVYAWDDVIEAPAAFGGLHMVDASDRNRFRAVEFLSGVEARNGTEMYQPMAEAARQLGGGYQDRERIVVLITDGQVGNESQLVNLVGTSLKGTRVFTLGIDQAVNAGLLQRLAQMTGARCELVESEDRLDNVMASIHQSIDAPLLTELLVTGNGISLDMAGVTPARLPDVFKGAPALIMGRYTGEPAGSITVTARQPDGSRFQQTVVGEQCVQPGLHAAWARGHIRDLEDRYELGRDREWLEKRILETSLRFGVMCRFTSFVAVDHAEVVNRSGHNHRVVQPVEVPAGWAEKSKKEAVLSRVPISPGAMPAPAPAAPPLGGAAAMGKAAANRPVDRMAQAPRKAPAQRMQDAPEMDGAAEVSDLLSAISAPPPGPMERLREAVETWRRSSSGDVRARLMALGVLLALLQELLGTSQADAQWNTHVRSLELLRDQLHARVVTGTTEEAAVMQTWVDAERALDAILNPPAPTTKKRASFWR